MEKDYLFSKVINNEKIVHFPSHQLGLKVTIFFTSFPQIKNVRLFSLGQSAGRGCAYPCGLNVRFLGH